ncbi:hypothetical protein GE09DRAFT_620712 [Coniochaeta sp. 2T2.1]|nr:hypothetical protein GE09DRAFT_620712 [Coniochaeta sp. 2T2.1]
MASSQPFKAIETDLSGITVLTPSSPQYAERRKIRCLNEAVEKIEPPAIAVPKSAQEVAAVVRWCVRNGLRFTVRSGGNDYFGRTVADGALVLDMRDINYVNVSADKKTATVGGGIIMKDLIEKLDTEDLLTPVGNIWIVGYVGWATLGGYGPLQHSHGLGIEQIVGAEIVTAKGEVVSVGKEDERLEGIRGMGGNLGVITAVTIKVYPKFDVSTCLVPKKARTNNPYQIFAGMLIYDASPKTIRAYHAAVSKLAIPKPLTIHMFVMNVPALGGPHLMVYWTWADSDHEKGKAYLADFLAATPPVKANHVASKSLLEHYAAIPDHNAPWGGMRTQYFSSMTAPLIETVVKALETIPNDPMVNISWSGGVPIDPAVKHMLGVGKEHVFVASSFFASKPENKDPADDWNRELLKSARETGKDVLLDAAHPGLTPLGEKSFQQILGAKAGRGWELKAKHDPENVFGLALPRF